MSQVPSLDPQGSRQPVMTSWAAGVPRHQVRAVPASKTFSGLVVHRSRWDSEETGVRSAGTPVVRGPSEARA